MAKRNRERGSDGQQFVVGILDGAATTAWLPATFIGAAAVFVLYARAWRTTDLMTVSHHIFVTQWQALVLFFPIAVFGAFFLESSIGAILGVLEGSWGGNVIGRWLAKAFIRVQVTRRRGLASTNRSQTRASFSNARARLLQDGLSDEEVAYLDYLVTGAPFPASDSIPHDLPPPLINWQDYVRPGEAWRLESLISRSREYPHPSMMRPTALGNILGAMDENLRKMERKPGRRGDATARRFLRVQEELRYRLEVLTGFFGASWIVALLIWVELGSSGIKYETSPEVLAFLVVALAYVTYRSMVATARRMLYASASMLTHTNSE
jgi:hypothetical protein